MEKKLSSLYWTFVPCKSFVSNCFIVGKTFTFYEKFLFSEYKTFAIFRFTIFEGRNIGENGQKSRKSRKFLPAKVSAPKVDHYLSSLLSVLWDLPTFPWRVVGSTLRQLFFLFSQNLFIAPKNSFPLSLLRLSGIPCIL